MAVRVQEEDVSMVEMQSLAFALVFTVLESRFSLHVTHLKRVIVTPAVYPRCFVFGIDISKIRVRICYQKIGNLELGFWSHVRSISDVHGSSRPPMFQTP